MSKRYIPQTPNNDFVYPNNDKVEYDVEILHEINDNVVQGTISGVTLSYSGDLLRLQYTYTYDRNGSIPFFRENGNQSILSVHMLAPGQEYFKPWRMIHSQSYAVSGDTFSASISRIIDPSQFQLSSWPAGQYVFEFRFIGLKQNYVICETATLAAGPTPTPTSTPTPTPTLTPGPPTPTPTATPVTPTPTPTGSTIYTHGAVRATCADFCNTNYTIGTLTSADNTYLALTLGDQIYGITGAGYIAYSNVSTDTVTGPFRVAQIDSFGTILDILVCSGGSCVPL